MYNLCMKELFILVSIVTIRKNIELIKKYLFFLFFGVFGGPQKPLFCVFRGFWGPPNTPKNKKINIFLLILHFFGYLSFPKLFYFLSLDRWKAFYDFFPEKSFFRSKFSLGVAQNPQNFKCPALHQFRSKTHQIFFGSSEHQTARHRG